jgi:hypothetical protein
MDGLQANAELWKIDIWVLYLLTLMRILSITYSAHKSGQSGRPMKSDCVEYNTRLEFILSAVLLHLIIESIT